MSALKAEFSPAGSRRGIQRACGRLSVADMERPHGKELRVASGS